MQVDEQDDKTAEFAAALRALYEAAGSPTYALLNHQALAQQRSVTITTSSLSDWLNGKSVPSDQAAADFLIAYLRGRALQRTPEFHVKPEWLEQLRVAARDQRREGKRRGGRPISPSRVNRDPVPSVRSRVELDPRVADGLFRGREQAVEKVCDWLVADAAAPVPLVVTGQPGAGKSAVVAHAVAQLRGAGRGPELAFDARAALHSEFVAAVGELVDAPPTASSAEVIELLGRSNACWSIVLDALDEVSKADDPSEGIERSAIVDTVMALAKLPSVRVVVATRPLAVGDRFRSSSLLRRLGVTSAESVNLVDLDSDTYFEPGPLHECASDLLTQRGAVSPFPPNGAWTRYAADASLRARLAAVIAQRAGRNYLVAALAAHQLSVDATPIDPAMPGFDASSIPSSVGEGLSKYLDQISDRPWRTHVRALLVALAYSWGSGVDDTIWLQFMAALGYPTTAADIDRFQDSRGVDYLLQSSLDDTGQPVTRLFHQALADELLEGRYQPRDKRALFEALLPASPEGWADAGGYALRHAADHGAACGQLDQLLVEPRYLAVAVLPRLLAVLPDQPSDQMIAEVVAVLRMTVHRAAPLSANRRARLFALSAAHLGVPALQDRFASCAVDDNMPAWAHQLGHVHQQLSGHTDAVDIVRIGRLGGRDVIVSAGYDATVRVWDQHGRPVGEPLTGHRGAVLAMAVGPLGGREVIVSGGTDGTLRVWDAELREIAVLVDSNDPVEAVAVGRLGRSDLIIVGGADGAIQAWDEDLQPLDRRPAAHDGPVNTICFGHLDGQDVVISGGEDGAVRIWDEVLDAIGTPITGLGRFPGVKAVATGHLRGRDIIAACTDEGVVEISDRHGGRVAGRPLLSVGNMRLALSIGRIGTYDVLVAADGADVVVLSWDDQDWPIGMNLVTEAGEVHTVAVGHLGGRDVVVAGCRDNTIRVWSQPERPVGTPMVGHERTVGALALGHHRTQGRSTGEVVLVSTADDATLRYWRPDGHPVGQPHISARGWWRTLAIGHLGQDEDEVVVGADFDNQLWVLDLAGNVRHGPLPTGGGRLARPIESVVVGRLFGRDVVISAGDDVSIWDERAEPVRRGLFTFGMIQHPTVVTAMTIGRLEGSDVLVTGDADGAVRVWGEHRDSSGSPFQAQLGRVGCLATGSLGGRDVIVTTGAGRDPTVKIWDAHGRPLGTPLHGHDERITGVAIGRLGGRDVIASASDDNTVRIWDVAMATCEVLDHLEGVVGVLIHDDCIYTASGSALCAWRRPRDQTVHEPDIWNSAVHRSVLEPLVIKADPEASLINIGIDVTTVEPQANLADTSRTVDVSRSLAAAGDATARRELAGSLIRHGLALRRAGRIGEAATAIQEATDLHRQLALPVSDGMDFERGEALYVLGAVASELSRYEEAVKAAAASVDIFRRLHHRRPNSVAVALAQALANLAICRADTGQLPAAVSAFAEADGLYQQATEPYADDVLVCFHAAALSGYAAMQLIVGSADETVAVVDTARRAVSLYRPIAEQFPELNPAFGAALTNLARALEATQQWRAAIEAAQEALELHRAEAAHRGHAADYFTALTLAVLGTAESNLGMHDRARDSLNQARDQYQILADHDFVTWGAALEAVLADLRALP